MKRYGNLYDRIIDYDNLVFAEKKARQGKVRQRGVLLFDKKRDANLQALHKSLSEGTFTTSNYTKFKVYEPKERDIYRLPYYPDRIVHHAIMNVLEPLLLKTFTYNTYSCVKNRGITACADQVRRIIQSFNGKPLFCLKIDIKKFYPSIKHDVLKAIVRRKFKDVKLLQLLDNIIDSEQGLPIGNYLSQYLSNLYLCYFMHFVNRKLKVKATEYADDICFFYSDKAVLREVFIKVKSFIENDLKLEIKGNYQIFPIAKNRADKHGRALDYVGFKFYRQHTLLRKSIKQNLMRKVSELCRKNVNLQQVKQQIAPWLGWCKHSNSKHLLNKILKLLNYNIMQRTYYSEKPTEILKAKQMLFYRWDIQETEATTEDGEKYLQYSANEVRVYAPFSQNKIIETVFTKAFGNDYENKLINEYNSAVNGLYDNDDVIAEKINRYSNFLKQRIALKQRIEEVCQQYGIE